MPVFIIPRWVSEGMKVIAPYPTPEKPQAGVWCTVACAAGNHARVINTFRGIDRWWPLDALRIPMTEPPPVAPCRSTP